MLPGKQPQIFVEVTTKWSEYMWALIQKWLAIVTDIFVEELKFY